VKKKRGVGRTRRKKKKTVKKPGGGKYGAAPWETGNRYNWKSMGGGGDFVLARGGSIGKTSLLD